MNREPIRVPMDPTLTDWLLRAAEAAPSPCAGAAGLVSGLRELRAGNAALLLEAPAEEQTARQELPGTMAAGDLKIVLKSRKVLFAGREISLTPKEFDILYFLAENRGEVFTKEQIYKAVWSDEYLLDDSNIMAFIRKLRKKIEPDPDAPKYILTIWGVGYKFNDEIP